ncbi:MAG TPA: phytanoyl-CoA dioxygenase family protein [Pseudomonadales bacterium]
MTPEQLTAFREHGYLYLPAALSKKQIEPLRARITEGLRKLREPSSARTLAALKATPTFQQIGKLSQLIPQDDLVSLLVSAVLLADVRELAGRELLAAQSQLLLTLPSSEPWTLERLNWHVDVTPRPGAQVPGIQAFMLLDDLSPKAGATLAIAGSHRVTGHDQDNKRIRALLRNGGDLAGTLRREDLALLEMTGRAGDLYLTDMRMLHTPAINASGKLRMMATVRFLPP